MQWALETYRVKTYVDNGQEHSSKLYRDLMAVVRQQARQALAYHPYGRFPQQKEAICGAAGPRVQVLHPQAGLDPDVCEKNQNNCSVVARLSVGRTRFLFPGDAENEEEELILGDASVRPELAADVLKVGHHGSDTSAGDEFLEAVNPSWMVISAGKKEVGTNKGYRHPRWSTVRELLAFAGPREGVRVIDAYDGERKQWRRPRIWGRLYVTAKDGTVVLSTNGSDIRRE
jgi:beta-lactamase superfamily II metal-dependent hydrolase